MELQTLKDNPPLNITDAVRRSRKQLSVYDKEGNRAELVQHIKIRLVETLTYLGAFDIATEYQVMRMADRIYACSWCLTPDELDYFFLSFSDGVYGKLYGGRSINPQDVMSALQNYISEVGQARGDIERERLQAEEKQKTRQMRENAVSYEEYCRMKGKPVDTPNPLEQALKSFSNKKI